MHFSYFLIFDYVSRANSYWAYAFHLTPKSINYLLIRAYFVSVQLALKAELVSEEVEKRILDMELRVEANEFKAQQKQREEEERLRQQSEAGCDEDDDDDDEDDGDDGSDDAIDRAAATQAQEAKQRGRRDMPPPVPRTHTGASARGKGADEKSASLKRKGRAESSNESSMNAAQRTQHRTRK